MLVPNPDYRPNPSRAIYVHGMIDESLIHHLTPTILELQAKGRQPITVYIDSKGGNTRAMETLLRLLGAPDHDGAPSCRIITVVTSRAASGAADLLSSGDYAVAYPGSSILYHGVRTSPGLPVTVETASSLAESLKVSNDRFAMALAAKSNWRFVFRYISSKQDFSQYRTPVNNPDLSDFDCFIELISEKLSPTAKKVMSRAKDRNQRYEAVVTFALKRALKASNTTRRRAEFESIMLKGIIDFELKANRQATWNFRNGGLEQVSDDFFLLGEYLSNYESQHLKGLCSGYGDFFLTEDDHKEIEQLKAEEQEAKKIEKIKPQIRPIWVFFVALCHALQEGEDWGLTASDAFWLGLIDEVLGDPDLPTLRLTVESQTGIAAAVNKQ